MLFFRLSLVRFRQSFRGEEPWASRLLQTTVSLLFFFFFNSSWLPLRLLKVYCSAKAQEGTLTDTFIVLLSLMRLYRRAVRAAEASSIRALGIKQKRSASAIGIWSIAITTRRYCAYCDASGLCGGEKMSLWITHRQEKNSVKGISLIGCFCCVSTWNDKQQLYFRWIKLCVKLFMLHSHQFTSF